jgi:glycosyltransferase XagB
VNHSAWLIVPYIALALGLAGVSGITLAWMLWAWRDGDSADRTSFPTPRVLDLDEPRRVSFSLIVAARHEEVVLERTLTQLAAVSHQDVEIIVVIGHDDESTAAVARSVAARQPDRVKIVIDTNTTKNKPLALNAGLAVCRNEVVGIFDAEDLVHPDLLTHVENCFLAGDVDVVQSGVQLMNYWASWYAVRNVLEYYFWFRSRLHFQAARHFVPLGGNTVFVYRKDLIALGGWDNNCLAEDCDLGVRLSAQGARTRVAYDKTLVTQEECPATLRSFLRQRTRWNQGYLQVLRKGDWKRLPRQNNRALAIGTLAMPFAQAFSGLLIPLSLAGIIFLRLPDAVALLSFLPLLPTLATLAVEVAALHEFGALYGRQPRLRDYSRLVLGAPLFQILLAYAAARAVVRELRGRRNWEKTEHQGDHLGASMPPAITLPASGDARVGARALAANQNGQRDGESTRQATRSATRTGQGLTP